MVVSESVRGRAGGPVQRSGPPARVSCGARRIVALAGLLLATVAVPVLAQGRASGRVDRVELAQLRRTIEEHYRVVPLRDGMALVPRGESPNVQSIELTGSTVAIDGVPVTGAELKARLKDDSDAILALSYLDPAGRQALFNIAPSPDLSQPGRGAESAGSGVTPSRPPSASQREVLPEAPAPARPSEGERDRRVRRSDAKVHIGGSVQVNEGESVDGPVVAVGGSVTVNGDVRDDIVAIGGGVHLGPRARVGGDVTAIGGAVDRDAQAEVSGRINEIGLRVPRIHVGPGFWLPARGLLTGAFGPGVEVMATLFRMVLFGLLAFLVFMIARDPVDRIERAAAVEPWKAGLIGIFTQLLFVPVFVLTVVILAISIVGIPLLLFVPPLAILALIAALVFGFTGVAYRVGRGAQERFGWARQPALLLLLVGLVGIWFITIVGRMTSLVGGPFWGVATALLIVGFLVEYVAWTVGLGAAVMTRFGTRPAGGSGPVTVSATPAATGQGGGTV